MNRETYERTELEIIKFRTEDVITTRSPLKKEDDETDMLLQEILTEKP